MERYRAAAGKANGPFFSDRFIMVEGYTGEMSL